MTMKYVKNVCDKGIILSPDKEGEEMYAWDGGGMREAILSEADGKYYLSYDGAMPGARPDSYWNACQAVSTDLVHWKKLGTNMLSSALTHPESNEKVYKDFRSASSPWSFFDGKKWYHYYVGADHCSENGVPAFEYSTMLAVSDEITGKWDKACDEEGCSKHVCLTMGPEGSWNDVTTSPGQVVENPKWASDPEHEKHYLMFYSGSCSGVTKRSLGIARTNDLGISDDYDKKDGTFWEKDPKPILPPEDDIENTSLFYEEESGLYWLFTNHIYNNEYTNSVWVYWTKDLEHWNAEDKAVVVDKTVSTWAKGAIGMPTVVRRGDTLEVLYDGVKGEGTGHLERHIGLAEIKLPVCVE